MLITQSNPMPVARAAQKSAPQASASTPEPVEIFDRPSEALMTIYARNPEARAAGATVAKGLGGALLGGAIGAYAGSQTGVLAGIAGAATLALPGALVGAVGVGVLAEKMGTTGSDTAGAAIIGGLVGGIGSLAAGAYIGSQVVSTVASIGMGLAGAAAGAYFAAN